MPSSIPKSLLLQIPRPNLENVRLQTGLHLPPATNAGDKPDPGIEPQSHTLKEDLSESSSPVCYAHVKGMREGFEDVG